MNFSMFSCVVRSKKKLYRPGRLRFAILLSTVLAGPFLWSPAASAVPLYYSVSGVEFNDGGVAWGYIIYDPVTHIFGQYDIITTAGTTGFPGYSYISGQTSPFAFPNTAFGFNAPGFTLFLDWQNAADVPGVYPLLPGVLNPAGFSNSGELGPGGVGPRTRVVTVGSIIAYSFSVPDGGHTMTFLGFSFLALALLRQRIRRIRFF